MIHPTFYRAKLAPIEQKAYLKLVEGLLGYENHITVTGFTPEVASIKRVLQAVHYDHPELFYVDFWSCTIEGDPIFRKVTYHFRFLLDAQTSKAVRATMEKKASGLRRRASDRRNDTERYLQVIKEMSGSTYKNTEDLFKDHTAAGPILHRTAVCEGLSMLFLFYCQRLSLPCSVVLGSLKGSPHAWNMVELDGERRFADMTSLISFPLIDLAPAKTLYRSEAALKECGYVWSDDFSLPADDESPF